MSNSNSPMKLVRLGLWAAVAIAGVVFGALYLSENSNKVQTATKSLPGAVQIGGPFTLTAHTGAAFNSESLKGKPYLVFFGFTHCPDICPTTLLDMTNQLKDLGEDGRDLQALFITVDPERDTQETLATYLSSFDPRIIGLTGDAAAIKKVAGQFLAQYEKAPASEGANPEDYSINHTATIFLMNRKGNFAGTLDFQEKPGVRAKKLKRLLAS